MRPHDTFTVYDQYDGFVEKKVTGKNYRMFIESAPRYYINQRNECAAIEVHRNIYMATPPGLRGKKKENKMYQDKTRHHCTPEELELIHQSYEDTLAGKYRRGAETRYWEDVTEGEELPVVMRGPCGRCRCLRSHDGQLLFLRLRHQVGLYARPSFHPPHRP